MTTMPSPKRDTSASDSGASSSYQALVAPPAKSDMELTRNKGVNCHAHERGTNKLRRRMVAAGPICARWPGLESLTRTDTKCSDGGDDSCMAVMLAGISVRATSTPRSYRPGWSW